MFYDYRFILHFLLLIFVLIFSFNGVVLIRTQSFYTSRRRKKYIEGPIAVAYGGYSRGIKLSLLSSDLKVFIRSRTSESEGESGDNHTCSP